MAQWAGQIQARYCRVPWSVPLMPREAGFRTFCLAAALGPRCCVQRQRPPAFSSLDRPSRVEGGAVLSRYQNAACLHPGAAAEAGALAVATIVNAENDTKVER